MVTGGGGFVGTTLVPDLLADGHRVVVYDDFSVGRRPAPAEGLQVVTGDIRDEAHLRTVLREHAVASVIHLAALHYIPHCNAHPVDTLHVNVVGTQALLEACREAGVARLVFASSAAVYGPSESAHREDEAHAPVDIYGLSKSIGEQQLAAFHRRTGIPCTAARLFNVFGQGETNPHLIPEILRQLAEHGDTLSLGALTPRRDYVHVTDVSRALRVFLGATDPGFSVYNVGTGHAASVRDIIASLEDILRRPLVVEQDPARLRPVDMPHLQADIARLQGDLGWSPATTLTAGLRDLVQASLPGAGDAGRPVP